MLVAALLSSIAAGACAAPDLCPTSKELGHAYLAFAEDRIWRNMVQQRSEDNVVVFMTPRAFRAVTDLTCGAPSEDAPRTINCAATFRYKGGARAYRILRVTRDGAHWTVLDLMEVWRER